MARRRWNASRRPDGKDRRLWSGLLLAILLLVAVSAASAAPAAPARAVPPAQADPTPRDEVIPLLGGRLMIHIPVDAGPTGVVALHSFGHTPVEQVEQGWSAAADRHRFVVIYPDRGLSWNAGLCCGDAAASRRDDVSWMASAIILARDKYHLSKIYLVGFSNGGMMVERLLAERPGLSSAFAVWGAAPEMPTAGRWAGEGFLFNGSLDLIVPMKGGIVSFRGITTTVRPTGETKIWLAGAHLCDITIRGGGHAPPVNWPEMAWKALRHEPL